MKSQATLHAFLIGFLIGIVIFSIAVNSFGFVMLIPLFLAYKLAKAPDASDSQHDDPASED